MLIPREEILPGLQGALERVAAELIARRLSDGPDDLGPAGKLWTYEDLESRWQVSRDAAERLVRRWDIPRVKLSGAVVRFRPGEVLAAERKAEGIERRRRERGNR